MPPKKDDKKGKKGAATALKEIDPTIYIRKQTPLSEVKDSPREPNPLLTGFVANVESVFPEWTIEGENWTEPIPEGQPEIVYPKNLNVTGSTNFTALYGLEPVEVVVDPKAKPAKKEAPKKGAKEEVPEVVELLVNADGKKLPVMFQDSESEFLGTIFSRDFARNLTPQQNEVKIDLDALQNQIIELKASSPEDSAKEIAQLEDKIQHIKSTSDLYTEGPTGSEIDPYIVAAYRTILRFAPTIISSASGSTAGDASSELDSSFLWRSIYPKLPNGKPLYNSSGKYAVRLFLAGKWRKVYVNDTLPTREDGSIAIAASNEKYELWPMILAKAIYTVYSGCGYAARFQDVEEGLTPTMNYETLDNSHPVTTIPAHKIAQFVAFAVHLMVGWQPANPIPIGNTFVHEKTKSARLLESILSGGIRAIDNDDIINDDDVLKNKRHFHSYANDDTIVAALKLGSDILDNGGKPILKTKKVFQQEYVDRKNKRDEIVAHILKREERIAKITQLLASQPVHELHTISLFNHETNEPRIFPILGIMFPDTSDLLDCKILIDWRTAPAVQIPEVVVSIGGTFQPDILKGHEGMVMRRDDETPLPLTTPVIYEWVTVSQLVAAHSYTIPISTNIRTPFQASYARHWAPLVAAAPAATTDKKEKAPAKGKDKNAAATPSVSAEEVLCGDEGVAPLTFLTVDTASFFATVDAHAAAHQEDEETALALAAQQIEMDRVTKEGSLDSADNKLFSATPSVALHHKKDEILYFQVLIHADMVNKPTPPASIEDPSANPTTAAATTAAPSTSGPPLSASSSGSQPQSAGQSRPTSSHGHNFSTITTSLMSRKPLPAIKQLPSDIVLILEEVRTDEQQPLMFIMDLKDTCFLPVMRRTFGIPQSRLKRDEPIVFWIRLFSKASFYINFTSVTKITIDDAEKVWTDLGKELFVSEGDAGITREATEQLLFRMPLLTTAAMPTAPPASAVDPSLQPGDDGWVDLDDLPEPQPAPQLQCKTFFYINDREIERHVILKVLDTLSNPDNSYYRLHQCLGNILNLHNDPQQCNTLIGTLLPALRGQNVPGFHWKLLIIADKGVPIVTPVKPVNEEAITQRYNGKYYANNKLALFRDIYSIEKSTFPISIRLNLSELPKAEGSNGSPSPVTVQKAATASHALIEGHEEDAFSVLTGEKDSEERLAAQDMHVVIRLYRKTDKKLVSEFRGKKLCVCYTQAIDPFLNEGEEVTAAPAAATKGKDVKPPAAAKGKAAPTAETIDIIVECELDTAVEEMTVLPHLKSRFPHVFDALYDPTAPDTPDVSLISPTIDLQNGCLSVKPPTAPQFQWELDILAGKVANISHDLTALEKFTASKNAWETASAGRTERAQAALAFYQERRKIEADYAQVIAAQMDLDNPTFAAVGEAKAMTELTPTMIENLVTALETEQAIIAERYKRVRALPQFSEEILYLEEDETEERMLIAPEKNDIHGHNTVHETAYERREKERAASQQRFVDICAKFVEYNARLREETKTRVSSLAEECVADLTAMSTLWAQREAFRIEAETRNAALSYVLNRSKVGVQKALESEVVVDDPKKKGKKK